MAGWQSRSTICPHGQRRALKSVQSAYGTPELATKFRSKDGTTEMISRWI